MSSDWTDLKLRSGTLRNDFETAFIPTDCSILVDEFRHTWICSFIGQICATIKFKCSSVKDRKREISSLGIVIREGTDALDHHCCLCHISIFLCFHPLSFICLDYQSYLMQNCIYLQRSVQFSYDIQPRHCTFMMLRLPRFLSRCLSKASQTTIYQQ